MKKRIAVRVLLTVSVILGIVTGVIFITAEIPWVAYITGYAAFGTFCLYMDQKSNSKKARR